MSSAVTYTEVPADRVPATLRWHVPQANTGQIVETAYAADRPQRDGACHGDPWMRVTDGSEPAGSQITYYKRVTLTAQDMVILGKMAKSPSLETSLSSSGWQPAERDVAAVNGMIERGILQVRPGFASIELTEGGSGAYADELDRRAEESNAL